MAEDKSEEANFTRMVVGSVATTMVLLLILPMIFVAGKSTYYSAYTEGEGGDISSLAQVTDMRDTMATDEGYFIANTMSTPMLVNDWRDPHRTALMIIGPEKPIAETEADAIYDFVTKNGVRLSSLLMEQMQIDWLKNLALLSLIPRSTMRISIGMNMMMMDNQSLDRG